jgi:hypothetical protein
VSDYPPISDYIVAARNFDDVEALPDPREAAELALLEVPWLRKPDVAAVLEKLDAKGLTICWRP